MSYYEQDNQDPYYEDRSNRDPGALPHSGLGVASFIISLIVVAMGLLAVVLIVIAAGQRYGRDSEPLAALFVGLLCLGSISALVGVGLGIGACFQENRNRTFGVIGLILNGVIVLAVAVLFLIGLMAGSRFWR